MIEKELSYFLFDPIEAIEEIEDCFVRHQGLWTWVKTARKRGEGWLREGLYAEEGADWEEAWWGALCDIARGEGERKTRRLFLEKMAQMHENLPYRSWSGKVLLQICELGRSFFSEKTSLSYDLTRAILVLRKAEEQENCGRTSPPSPPPPQAAERPIEKHPNARQQGVQGGVAPLRGVGQRPTSQITEYEPTATGCLAYLYDEIRKIEGEERQLDAWLGLCDAFSLCGAEDWAWEEVERLCEHLNGLTQRGLAWRCGHLLHEQWLGEEGLRAELLQRSRMGFFTTRILSWGFEAGEGARAEVARRIHFSLQWLKWPQEVEKRAWEELLALFDKTEPWRHEERDLQGRVMWSLSSHSALLRWLSRDFGRETDRAWVRESFVRLRGCLWRLEQGQERQEALIDLVENLFLCQKGFENQELIGSLLMEEGLQEEDRSAFFEGVAKGFLQYGALLEAYESLSQIQSSQRKDPLLEALFWRYIEREMGERALEMLVEIADPQQREVLALKAADVSCILSDPIAASMLCEMALFLTGATETIIHKMLRHEATPKEMLHALVFVWQESQAEERPALLAEKEESLPLSMKQRWEKRRLEERWMGRREREQRLDEIRRWRNEIPRQAYEKRIHELLGIQEEKESKRMKEEAHPPKIQILVDSPHRYGSHWATPREHIQKNHFSSEVGGSLFTHWKDFDAMWEELQAEAERQVFVKRKDSRVLVLVLELAIIVGRVGVSPLSQLPPERLRLESRDGQISLVYETFELGEETQKLTLVIGEKEQAPTLHQDVRDSEKKAFVLYTAYPGSPSPPIPLCDENNRESFSKGMKEAFSRLQQRRVKEAERYLYNTYRSIGGEESASHYWSQHVLRRRPRV